MKIVRSNSVGSRRVILAAVVALVSIVMLIPLQGFTAETSQYKTKNPYTEPKKSVVNVSALNDLLKNRGKVDEWGCNGLFCDCTGGANSPSCKIVAPHCVDDIICIGDKCSCVWGGGP